MKKSLKMKIQCVRKKKFETFEEALKIKLDNKHIYICEICNKIHIKKLRRIK